MARLTDIENLIFPILRDVPETRDDDMKLYLEVLKHLGVYVGCTLEHFLSNRRLYPSYESISRCRRKIQHFNPELGTSRVRKALEEEYRLYAMQ